MVKVPLDRYVTFAVIALTGVWWDLYSKWSVFQQLGYPGKSTWESRPLGSFFRFQLQTSFNRGALAGIGQEYTGVLALLSIVAAIGVVVWLFWFKAAVSRWLTVSLALVFAGTLGNLYDRLGLHGWRDDHGAVLCAVRDFLDFRFFELERFDYPIFNFADSFLVTGAIMLAIHSIWAPVAAGEQSASLPEGQIAPAARSA